MSQTTTPFDGTLSKGSRPHTHNEPYNESDFSSEHSDRILMKYKNRVPILIWNVDKGVEIVKRKFIVPMDITLGQFLFVLRKQITNMTSVDGLFLFVHKSNTMLPVGDVIGKIYKEHKQDGFLRLVLAKENTFG